MLTTAAAAFLVALAAAPLARRLARRCGLLDRPNERSLHAVVTPRSGGLAVLAGLAAGLAVSASAWIGGRPRASAWLLGAILVTLLGLLDDRFGLPAWPRLAGQLLAALVLVGVVGGVSRLPLPAPLDLGLGPFGSLVAMLWIVAVVNFYNFMDGIDGLATLQAVITATGLALALAQQAFAGHLAAALAAAALAFLAFNWSPASVFLGDGGSGLIGYTLATLPLLATPERRPEAVTLAAASLFLFLADATVCLLRRMARGERWYAAHREHFYQRWVGSGASHSQVASVVGAAGLVLTAVALVGWQRREAAWSWLALLAGMVFVSVEAVLVRRLERHAPGRDGTR